MKLPESFAKYPSAWVLIVSNLVPLLGMLFLGWDVRSIVILYWAESGVVGFYTILKMVFAQGESVPVDKVLQALRHGPKEYKEVNIRLVSGFLRSFSPSIMKVPLIPFFMFHYGMFMAVHGVFLFVLLFGTASPGISPEYLSLILGVIAFFVSHGYSFMQNYMRGGEYRTSTLQSVMFSPYPRIIVMHITIIIGAFFFLATNLPGVFLVLLVAMKTLIDVVAHLRERDKHVSPA